MAKKVSPFTHDRRLAYLLLVPATLFLFLVIILPLLRGIQISFFRSSVLSPYTFRFAGLYQYKKVFSLENTDFWNALRHSLIWTSLSVSCSYCIGLFLALLLNRDIKGRGIFRAILLVPWVMPSVVASAQWKIMYASYGVINTILQSIGLINRPILFLGSTKLALISVSVVNIWRNYPFMTVVLLASLQTISNELYEGAQIDGASPWQRFRYITLPLLRPVSMIALILVAIWSFNNFDFIFLITAGGPAGASEVLPTYMYLEAFRRLNPSFAASIATSMLLVLIVFLIFYMRQYRKSVEY